MSGSKHCQVSKRLDQVTYMHTEKNNAGGMTTQHSGADLLVLVRKPLGARTRISPFWMGLIRVLKCSEI